MLILAPLLGGNSIFGRLVKRSFWPVRGQVERLPSAGHTLRGSHRGWPARSVRMRLRRGIEVWAGGPCPNRVLPVQRLLFLLLSAAQAALFFLETLGALR